MLEFTHERLLEDEPPAGLTPRLAPLVWRCIENARQCMAAVTELCGEAEGYIDDGGLRFAVIEDAAELSPGRALALFLDAEDGDALAAVTDRMEYCMHLPAGGR